jgi:hypothetical protein
MENNLLNNSLLEVSRALRPLSAVNDASKATDLMRKLGYELPAAQTFTSIPVSLIGKAAAIADDITALADATTDEDKLKALLQLTAKVAEVCADIAQIAQNMQSAGAAAANFFANAPVDELPRRILDYIVAVYMETYYSGIYYFLLLLGVVDEIEKTANPAIFQPAFTLRKICWERLPKYINEPLDLSEEIYQWKTNFNSDLFLTRLEKVLRGFVLPGGIYDQNPKTRTGLGNTASGTKEIRIPVFQAGDSPELYSQFGVVVSGAEASGGKPKGLALMPYAMGGSTLPFNLNENYDIVLELKAGIDNGLGIVLRPPLDLEFINNLFTAPGAVGDFEIKVSLKKKAGKEVETFLFGSATTSHLSVKGMEFSVFFTKKNSDADFGVEFEIKNGKVVVGAEGADGFIEQMLSGIHMEMDFGLGIGFTSKSGFYFRGSGGLEIAIPLHLSLGPLNIENLLLKLNPVDGTFPLVAATTFNLSLGPLQAVVENIGVKLTLSFPDGGGNMGPANVDLGFQPPNGVGLSINAGAVIGGGYLFFDFEKEEYAGALELTIAGFISAKAIGIITTKMPDGSKGFSLLIIITAEFMPAFQLGYGFTLNAVGGLLGLNRTMLLDPLREAVRTGAVTSIMFPQNVVANATRIISDLKTIFPPAEGKFLIGPMAKIGWGTPSLITLSLGLIIEIPGNIAILGILKIALPEERVPLVQIQVLFVGTLDFDKQMLTFDASLYDSFILFMTLEGDMAVRLKWGDQPDFLITVGGFHPSYTPPPLALPALRRLSINILNTSISKIRVECYQAITSNTVQFGAKADISFDLDVCAIKGDIGFDALFQFNPFYFIISLSANFTLSAVGIDVMSVHIRMSLEGVTPWRAKGTGSVSLLFFDISADFDITWGDSKNTSLPKISILPGFLAELNKRENWSTVLSIGKNLLVTLRKMDEAESNLVLHPAGSLVVQQKLIPLEILFDKVGNNKTDDVKMVEITDADIGGTSLKCTDVNDYFARAQYQTLSDADKLSKPSFEQMPGGVQLSSNDNKAENGKMVRKNVLYEITIIDKEPVKPFKKGILYQPNDLLFTHFLKGTSITGSVLSKSYQSKLKPFDDKMSVKQDGFTVAFQSNNKAYDHKATFSSEMEADTYMKQQVNLNPNLKKDLHIIPNYELQES